MVYSTLGRPRSSPVPACCRRSRRLRDILGMDRSRGSYHQDQLRPDSRRSQGLGILSPRASPKSPLRDCSSLFYLSVVTVAALLQTPRIYILGVAANDSTSRVPGPA